MILDRDRIAAGLPGYLLGTELGRGGAGIVLAAEDPAGRRVAVKVMPLDSGDEPRFGATGLPRAAAAAGPDGEAEARLLATLSHPHLVKISHHTVHEDLVLIVMEVLDGGSLQRRAVAGLSLEAACAVTLGTAAALGYAHSRGILHRDVKPANILFTASGIPKVADFGIAHALGPLPGRRGSTAPAGGTPRYMAPEQFTLGELSPATDVYGLGAVLYELLARRPLFHVRPSTSEGWARHHLTVPPRPLTGIPEPVARVVEGALRKEPAHRPADAHAFALALARAIAGARGPGWLARAGTPTFLDEDLLAAASGGSPPRQAGGPGQSATGSAGAHRGQLHGLGADHGPGRGTARGADDGLELVLDEPAPTADSQPRSAAGAEADSAERGRDPVPWSRPESGAEAPPDATAPLDGVPAPAGAAPTLTATDGGQEPMVPGGGRSARPRAFAVLATGVAVALITLVVLLL